VNFRNLQLLKLLSVVTRWIAIAFIIFFYRPTWSQLARQHAYIL
jgi:hypothetical protein